MANAPRPYLRGISGNDFQNFDRGEQILPLSKKLFRWIKEPRNATFLMFYGFVFTCVFGFFTGFGLFPTIFFLSLGFWLLSLQETSPLRIPVHENLLDIKNTRPNTKPQKGKGVFYVGTENQTRKEIWLSDDDCRQHFMIFGTTGAGKSELLFGFCSNFMAFGSGLIFVDGKGDIKTFASISALTKRWNREADLRVINFAPINEQDVAPGEITTNSFNPYTTAPPADMVTMISGLMSIGKEDVWSQRANQLLKAVIYVMAWARDNGKLDMNPTSIARYMELPELIKFLTDENFEGMPNYLEEQLFAYLSSLPLFKRDQWNQDDRKLRGKDEQGKPIEIGEKAFEQHTYLLMQLSGPMSLMTSDFRHVFMAKYGDIDFFDVLFNRRILVVLLPSMGQTTQQVAQMGRIIVGALKSMLGACLGSLGTHSQSFVDDVVNLRPTNAPSAFAVILDEVGSYLVTGMAQMAAQVRSFGISMIFASQDRTQMTRFDEKEANSIIANTNTQIIMRSQDTDALKLAIEVGGKEYRARTTQMSLNKQAMSENSWKDADSISISNENRINELDIRAQKEGDFHLFHADQLIRGKGFYTNALGNFKDAGNISISPIQMLTVRRPQMDLAKGAKYIPQMMKVLLNKDLLEERRRAILEKDCFDKAANDIGPLISILRNEKGVLGPFRTSYLIPSIIGVASVSFINNAVNYKMEIAANHKKIDQTINKTAKHIGGMVVEDEEDKFEIIDIENNTSPVSGIEVNNGGLTEIDAIEDGNSNIDLIGDGVEEMDYAIAPDNIEDPHAYFKSLSQAAEKDNALLPPENSFALTSFEEENEEVAFAHQEVGKEENTETPYEYEAADDYASNMFKISSMAVSGKVDQEFVRSSSTDKSIQKINHFMQGKEDDDLSLTENDTERSSDGEKASQTLFAEKAAFEEEEDNQIQSNVVAQPEIESDEDFTPSPWNIANDIEVLNEDVNRQNDDSTSNLDAYKDSSSFLADDDNILDEPPAINEDDDFVDEPPAISEDDDFTEETDEPQAISEAGEEEAISVEDSPLDDKALLPEEVSDEIEGDDEEIYEEEGEETSEKTDNSQKDGEKDKEGEKSGALLKDRELDEFI